MKLTDEIKACKANIGDLEFNLAVERALLERFVAMENGDQSAAPDGPRRIIPDSIVPHIQSILLAKGKSMKVAQVAREIELRGIEVKGKTDLKRLISSALIRRSDLFKRVHRGLYRLKAEKAEET